MTSIPVGESTTESSTATKLVTFSNYPNDFVPIEGTKFLVKFTNSNTATTQMKLQIGSLIKNCTCRGVSMGANSVRAGAKIEFTYDGDTFDCQFAEPISSIDTNSASPVNSSAINGALTDYQKATLSITTETNADTLKDIGIYHFTNVKITNIPTEATTGNVSHGFIEVNSYGGANKEQFLRTYNAGKVYVAFRRFNGSTWGDWEKYIKETDLTDYAKTENVMPVTRVTDANLAVNTEKKYIDKVFYVPYTSANLPSVNGARNWRIEYKPRYTDSGYLQGLQIAYAMHNGGEVATRYANFTNNQWEFGTWQIHTTQSDIEYYTVDTTKRSVAELVTLLKSKTTKGKTLNFKCTNINTWQNGLHIYDYRGLTAENVRVLNAYGRFNWVDNEIFYLEIFDSGYIVKDGTETIYIAPHYTIYSSTGYNNEHEWKIVY